MTSRVNKVCIIGAGCSGLVSIKCCLEDELNPVCYEIASDIGGLWNRAERIRLDLKPTMYDSLICNISKVNQSFSDYLYPEEWPPYVPWSKVMDFFNMYADQFDLRSYIKFNTKVLRVYKSKTYTETGSWMVETINLLTDEREVKEYDAVIAATGKITKPICPDIPGLKEHFKGKYMHACDYLGNSGLEDKTVLVVGSSNSGADIASYTSTVAKNVMLSSRNGVWILPRIMNNGVPLDISLFNRFKSNLLEWLPSFFTNLIAKQAVKAFKSKLDYKAAGLEPRYLPTHPLSTKAINDELPIKIYTGRVLTRPGIKCITPEGKIQFVDGREDNIDVIIAATGYDPSYPYLPKEVFSNIEDSKLYRWIFPCELEHPHTLTIVGLYPDQGGAGCSQSELQARYVTGVLSGKIKLPSKKIMDERCLSTRKSMTVDGKLIFKLRIFLYQEKLAKELGLIPSFFKLLFTDPRLAMKMYFGPIIAVHYRVIGEHKWKDAREHALNVWQHCLSGMNHAKRPEQ